MEALLAGGARDVTVLDISPTALARLRERLGAAADRVQWITDDVRDWEPDRTFALWHDRAVFHFMVSAGDRERYLRAVARGARCPGATSSWAPSPPTGRRGARAFRSPGTGRRSSPPRSATASG